MQADPSASAGAPTPPISAISRGTTGFDAGAHGGYAPQGAGPVGGLGAARPTQRPTGYVTGAYQPSGDVYVDRMLRLEHALKLHGPKT